MGSSGIACIANAMVHDLLRDISDIFMIHMANFLLTRMSFGRLPKVGIFCIDPSLYTMPVELHLGLNGKFQSQTTQEYNRWNVICTHTPKHTATHSLTPPPHAISYHDYPLII